MLTLIIPAGFKTSSETTGFAVNLRQIHKLIVRHAYNNAAIKAIALGCASMIICNYIPLLIKLNIIDI